ARDRPLHGRGERPRVGSRPRRNEGRRRAERARGEDRRALRRRRRGEGDGGPAGPERQVALRGGRELGGGGWGGNDARPLARALGVRRLERRRATRLSFLQSPAPSLQPPSEFWFRRRLREIERQQELRVRLRLLDLLLQELHRVGGVHVVQDLAEDP